MKWSLFASKEDEAWIKPKPQEKDTCESCGREHPEISSAAQAAAKPHSDVIWAFAKMLTDLILDDERIKGALKRKDARDLVLGTTAMTLACLSAPRIYLSDATRHALNELRKVKATEVKKEPLQDTLETKLLDMVLNQATYSRREIKQKNEDLKAIHETLVERYRKDLCERK